MFHSGYGTHNTERRQSVHALTVLSVFRHLLVERGNEIKRDMEKGMDSQHISLLHPENPRKKNIFLYLITPLITKRGA